MRKDMYLGILGILLHVNIQNGVNCVAQGDTCSSIPTVSPYSDACMSLIGLVNRTTHTQQEVCLVYNEVANCIRNKVIASGRSCDIANLIPTLSKLIPHTSWMSDLHVDTCFVTELTEPLCSSPDRLGLVSLLACGTSILSGFTGSKTFVCLSIPNIDLCAAGYIIFFSGIRCSSDNLKHSLTSSTAKEWLSSHFPDLNLRQCFEVYQAGQSTQDSECTDISYISRHTTHAIPVMSQVNVTAAGKQQYCKTLFYALHLLQHEMEQLGHVCTISDLKEFTKVLGYQGASDPICQDELSISTSDFCNDATGVLLVAGSDPYCKSFISHVAVSTTERQTCNIVRQFITCVETKLHFAGFDCSPSIFNDQNIGNFLQTSYHLTLPTTC